jgi:hypothetical protein
LRLFISVRFFMSVLPSSLPAGISRVDEQVLFRPVCPGFILFKFFLRRGELLFRTSLVIVVKLPSTLLLCLLGSLLHDRTTLVLGLFEDFVQMGVILRTEALGLTFLSTVAFEAFKLEICTWVLLVGMVLISRVVLIFSLFRLLRTHMVS